MNFPENPTSEVIEKLQETSAKRMDTHCGKLGWRGGIHCPHDTRCGGRLSGDFKTDNLQILIVPKCACKFLPPGPPAGLPHPPDAGGDDHLPCVDVRVDSVLLDVISGVVCGEEVEI